MNVESGDTGSPEADTAGAAHRESVDDVYTRTRADLLRLAHLLTGSLDLAEDVVHDAFVASSRRWATIESPEAYLRRAVTNAAYSALRSLGRDRDKSDRFGRRATVTLENPDLDETWDVLRSLPDRQRMAIVLRFYEDRPEAEIAGLLDCRPATVRSLIHRGLAKVRKEMDR